MEELIEVLQTIDEFTPEKTEETVKAWIAEKAYNMGAVMNAFRLSVVGESKGPNMFDIISIIGNDETILRLKKAIEVLG
jgi:glutamyl-tRNA synthetase